MFLACNSEAGSLYWVSNRPDYGALSYCGLEQLEPFAVWSSSPKTLMSHEKGAIYEDPVYPVPLQFIFTMVL